MKKFIYSLSILMIIFTCNVNYTYAIAVSDYTVATNFPTNYGYNLNLDYVYHYKSASGVAVDHYWLLTAAHVADNGGTGSLIINGDTYHQLQIIFHDKADLALVKFDKPFPGYYFLDGIIKHKGSGFFGTTVWDELIMCGYGYDGAVASDYFTQGTSYGVRRWGTNKGTKEETVIIDVGGSSGMRTSSCFRVNFNLSDTDYEAGGNTGDSGGGTFATNAMGRWDLAGITAYRTVNGDNNGTGNSIIKISDYISWIKSVITDYDSDGDFLPDWWEEKYSSSATAMNAQDDTDSDNVSNYEEWTADTNPTNSSSFFHIIEWNAPTNIVFVSSTNRLFSIEYCTNLVNSYEQWKTNNDWFIGDDMQTSKNILTNDMGRFYRINVKLP